MSQEVNQEIIDILNELGDVTNRLRHAFVSKDDLVELLVISAIAQEHLLIIGPPGTGKSELIKRFATYCGGAAPADGERVPYFEYLLTRFTEPNEIFGAINVARLTQDRAQQTQDEGAWRDTRGMLPRAEVAFLDEVFKANSAILNALLSILNERVFYNGPKPETVPLLTAVGAANEVPDDPELSALYDRFLLRAWTDNVEENQFPTLFARGWELEQRRIAEGYGLREHSLTTTRALKRLHRELGRVDLNPIAGEYREVVRRIRAEGIHLSDRRAIKLLKLIAASALRERRLAAAPGDFWVLRHVWNDPEQIPHLQTILDPYVRESAAEAGRAERALGRIAEAQTKLGADLDRLRTDTEYADFLHQAEGLRRELERHSSGDPRAAETERGRRAELLRGMEKLIDTVMTRLDRADAAGGPAA